MVGVRADTVKYVGVTWQQHSPNDMEEEESTIIIHQGIAWLNNLENICRKRRGGIGQFFNRRLSGSPYGGEEQWRAAMIRVSTGGQTINRDETKPRMMTQTESLDLLKTIQNLRPRGDYAVAAQYMTSVSNRAYRRKPFITSRGLLGLGPSDAKENDLTIIFHGSNMVHVVRSCDKDTFCIVGDAYIEGIMEGEFMVDNPGSEIFKLV